jgi:hypothetical protein
MARRISIKRLRDKYGTENIRTKRYQQVINEILEDNQKAVGLNIGKISNKTWKKESEKLLDRKTKKPVVLSYPDFGEILPNKRVFSIKAAESGKMITQTLRNRLNTALRESLKDFTREGTKYRGRLRQEIVKDMKKRVKDVFQEYTKVNPEYGVPSNIRNIATTEVRSTVNMVREQYVLTLAEKNKGKVAFFKTWIQNKSTAKVPRKSHAAVHMKRVGLTEKFAVPIYQKVKGRYYKTGKTIYMDRPHDTTAPAEEVIGCGCEVKYTAKTI